MKKRLAEAILKVEGNDPHANARFAKKIGRDPKRVNEWLNEKRKYHNPNEADLDKIEEVYRVRKVWLRSGVAPMFVDDLPQQQPTQPPQPAQQQPQQQPPFDFNASRGAFETIILNCQHQISNCQDEIKGFQKEIQTCHEIILQQSRIIKNLSKNQAGNSSTLSGRVEPDAPDKQHDKQHDTQQAKLQDKKESDPPRPRIPRSYIKHPDTARH